MTKCLRISTPETAVHGDQSQTHVTTKEEGKTLRATETSGDKGDSGRVGSERISVVEI